MCDMQIAVSKWRLSVRLWPSSRLFHSVLIALALGLFVLGTDYVVAQTPDPVETLLNGMSNPSYKKREEGTKAVVDFLRKADTTQTQRKQIRQAAEGHPNLEIRWRAAAALSFYNLNLPQVKMAFDLVKIRHTGANAFGATFTFDDGIQGIAPERLVGKEFQTPELTTLEQLNRDFRMAVSKGDVTEGGRVLDKMLLVFERRGVPGVFFLDARGIPQSDLPVNVKQKLEAARQKLTGAKDQISAVFGPEPAGSQGVRPVNGPGMVNTGGTFRIAFEDVPTPGEIIVESGPYEYAFNDPPQGFQFVGHSFEVSTNNLNANGQVQIGIEFGISSEQQLNRPVDEALPLELVRIANGEFEFLSTNVDFANRMATAIYLAQPFESLEHDTFSQFGQFALVQPIPEPERLPLSLFAIGVILRTCRSRRTTKSMQPQLPEPKK